MESEVWTMEGGKCKVGGEGGKWKVGDVRWKVEGGKCRV